MPAQHVKASERAHEDTSPAKRAAAQNDTQRVQIGLGGQFAIWGFRLGGGADWAGRGFRLGGGGSIRICAFWLDSRGLKAHVFTGCVCYTLVEQA